MFRDLLHRFLLPQLLLIVLPLVALAVVAGIQLSGGGGGPVGPVVWCAILGCVLATAVSALLAVRFLRWHLRAVSDQISAAVPAVAPKYPDDYSTLLDQIARNLVDLTAGASKDQAQLLTIISSMSDGLIAMDHEQRVLLTNDAAADLLTFRTPDARGKQLWEIVPLDGVLKAVTEVSLTGRRKTIPVGPVNGRHLDVTVTRLPLRPAGFIIVAHDVTETMRYEELRKEFVANVSHELRTPLTVIKGYVETLQDGVLDDRPRAMQFLATVEKHTEQLTNLVNDLLSLSRLDSTNAVPSPRPVHLARVAQRVAELMAPAAEKKRHKLVIQLADGLRPVIGNPEYLERAVTNLLENAIKYTREDGLIKLVLRAENGHLLIEVIDNGIGIAPSDLPRIFERFYRADRSRSRDMGGTGLGLSIVKHIVQAHHGSIEVQSALGSGSTFRLRFPAAPAAHEEPAAAGDAPAGGSASPAANADAGGAAA
ncbi:MAG TPA: ATP-binding protein [Tepidisphaeraceae bacterium]|nr:ATP-binding protein [Tepidisphaeraceae bacterium]